jgi:hypothetical protein
MASIDNMKKRVEKVHAKHTKTAEKLAALQAQFDAEKRALQEEKNKVNNEWVKDFAFIADKEGIQISLLNIEQLVELVKENKSSLLEEEEVITENETIDANAHSEEER